MIVWNTIKKYFLMLGVTAAMIILTLIIAPQTRSASAILSVFQQAIAPAILGWGVYFNIKAGSWDFSVGAEVLIAAIIGGTLAMKIGGGVPVLILLCAVIGCACGLLTGLIYKLLHIPTIICSIGMLMVYESIASLVFGGNGVMMTNNYLALGRFPYSLIYVIVVLFIAYVLFYKLKIGYNIKAVGSNPSVAESNGIKIYNTKMWGIAIAGIFAGLYAAMILSSSGIQRPVASMQTMATCFNAMMCVFIGFAIAGGGNEMIAVYFGAVIMQLIQLLLLALKFPSQYNKVVIAIIVILFMMFSSNTPIFRENRERKKRIKEIAGRKDVM